LKDATASLRNCGRIALSGQNITQALYFENSFSELSS